MMLLTQLQLAMANGGVDVGVNNIPVLLTGDKLSQDFQSYLMAVHSSISVKLVHIGKC